VDWQLWIQDGPKPLPVRYVITAPGAAGAPQYEVNIRKWNTNPGLTDAEFKFVPPKGAQRIEFMKLEQPTPSGGGGK
jgi:hypothetical protein